MIVLKKLAQEIRKDMISVLVPKESHHIGCSLSIVDLLTFLYFKIMKINPLHPSQTDRDIFILSKGHGALALYGVLYKKGFFNKKVLKEYDRNDGRLSEHATTKVPGVELSTGSLGHGLPVGIGFILANLKDKKNNKVYVLMSDGELNEGSNWEAIMFAGYHQLKNLIIIIDLNGMQGYGKTEKILNLNPLTEKFKSFNWNTYEIDGHNFDEMKNIFKKIGRSKNNLPHCIIAKTIKGKGIIFFEGKFESHYKSIDIETKNKLLFSL